LAEENKLSFQKLTEDLDKLTEEPVEKSEGLENAEAVQDPAEEPKEEPKEEEKVEETEEPAEEPKEEQPEKEGEKVEEEPKPEADPEKGEEVEKSEKPEKEEDDKDAKGKDKGKDKSKKKAEDKEEKDEVKKSAEPSISEADFVGAFEAVVKSFGSVQKNQASLEEKVEALSKSLSEVLALLKPEEVEKSNEIQANIEVEDTADVEAIAEAVKDKIEKSVQEDEEPEGKAVESIVKSEDGVVVPEVEAEVEQEEAVFNPKEHVDAVMAYYMNPARNLSSDERFHLRAAMNRVNRNEATEVDVAAFKQIAGFDAK
jgi:hypothetical protein